MFYVYEWFIVPTNEIFYVGKGSKERYKQTTKRNRYFNYFYNNFECDVRIYKYFKTEEEAFKCEEDRISELKEKGLCKANIDKGGKGGCNFVWTKEMRNYKSKYNPMKTQEQKERMSKNNPMKNEEVKKKVVAKISKPIYIGDKYYPSVKQASIELGTSDTRVHYWLKRGRTADFVSVRYANEEPKEMAINHWKTKKIMIDGVVYNSVREGAKATNITASALIVAMKNNRKCKHHTCSYV